MKQKVLQIGPFVKNDQDATRIQKILVISLLPLLFFAWFKNGIYPYLHGNLTTSEMVLPLLLIFCSVVPGLLVYWLGNQIKKEKITRYHWLELLSLSFIYACLLPMQASLIVVIIVVFSYQLWNLSFQIINLEILQSSVFYLFFLLPL